MKRDDIIRMAREAGAAPYTNRHYPDRTTHTFSPNQLERFAAFVAAAEREACAKVCESLSLEWEDQPNIAQAELATMMDCALAIRARGQA